MSYWAGKHSSNESPLSISAKHQVAVSPEPEGATFGWLVECRCGWQARVPRQPDGVTVDELKGGLKGIAINHFDRHRLESVNKEIIWPSSLSPSVESQEKPSQSQGQLLEAPSVDRPEQPQVTQPESQPVKLSPVEKETKEVSPSLQSSGTSPTPVVSPAPVPSPSTDSQVVTSVPSPTPTSPAPPQQGPSTPIPTPTKPTVTAAKT